MSFTVTWVCEGCERKFVGTADHLVDAIQALCHSAPPDHSGDLGKELAALDRKTQEIEGLGAVLTALGLKPEDVEIMEPLSMEQFRAMMRGERPPEKSDG